MTIVMWNSDYYKTSTNIVFERNEYKITFLDSNKNKVTIAVKDVKRIEP